MAENMAKWPSKRGSISKIMPSDGCGRDAVPLAVGRWYYFHEFGCHLGNVGSKGESHRAQSWHASRVTRERALGPSGVAEASSMEAMTNDCCSTTRASNTASNLSRVRSLGSIRTALTPISTTAI